MEIKEFDYHGKPRKVLITEETRTHIAGIDLSLVDEKKRDDLVKLTEGISHMKWSEMKKKDVEKDLAVIRPYFAGAFRNFKKSEIKEFKDESLPE